MTLLIGTAIGMVAMLAIIAIAKVVNKKEDTAAPVVEVSAKEQQEIIANFGGKEVPFTISANVLGELTNLNVDWVDAYGTRYMNFDAALGCPELTTEETAAIKKISASLAVVRKEKMNSKRYLEVRDMLDGQVHIYQPCKMRLDVQGSVARVALELVRNQDLTLTINTVMVSKYDVTLNKDRYDFDMLNLDDVESFRLLVLEDKEYEVEMEEFAKIQGRIDHYNRLVKKDRVAMAEDGTIVIYPPSPEEIKEMRKEKKKPATETEEIKLEVEEFVDASSL